MTRDRTRFQLSKKGGTRYFKGLYWYRQDSTQLLCFVPAFNHIRRGGILQSPYNQEEIKMINGIAHLFTQIKSNIAQLRGIQISGYVDSSEVSCVTNRAVLICALDIILYEHRKKYGNQLNGLNGKQALHHKLLLKYKWPLSLIRDLTLTDALLALHDEIQFSSLPEPVSEYLSRITHSNYPVNFPDYLDAEWDPELSEKFLIEIQG
ncbi:hypothetical protein AB3B40_003776 [Escherichia coli]|nr:hypothetical protein [Escherichia coli]